MDIRLFYMLDSKHSSLTLQAHAVGLENVPLNDGLAVEWRLIMGNYSGISFPVFFKQEYGKKLEDFLDTGWPNLFLISNKVKTVLEENSLTGWQIFAIKLVDRKGLEIDGYHGLSILGRCGKIDFSKSDVIEKKLVPNGSIVKYYKGLHVGLDEWDMSDIFLPYKYFGTIVSQKAAEVLKKNKITNIKLTNLMDIEIDDYTVAIAQKK